VPGNHDPDLKPRDRSWAPLEAMPAGEPGPPGCVNIDGRAVEAGGLRVAGLGGSVRYRPGPNQYSQAQMARRALKLDVRLRLHPVRAGRKLDILVTHAPPFGMPPSDDPAHAGFRAFVRLIRSFHPLLAVHGHVHPYGRTEAERRLGQTRVVNAVPSRLIEV